MPQFIYRIVSPKTFEESNIDGKYFNIDLDHPFNWNVASSKSWDYAEEQDKKHPSEGYMERHMKRARWHFADRNLRAEDFDIDVLIPQKAGVHDPLEGFVIIPETIRFDSKSISARVKRIVNNNWRAICFSTVDCEQNKIEDFIRKKIDETNGYGYQYRHFLYSELTEELLNDMISASLEVSPRIGAAGIKPHYFDGNSSELGGILIPPLMSISGCVFPASMLRQDSSRVQFGDLELTRSDRAEFEEDIKNATPFKYAPAFKQEEEIRFCFYSFDSWPSERIRLKIIKEKFNFGETNTLK